MKRREFLSVLDSAAAMWPLAARAQQPRTRVIGVLWPGTTPPASPRMESFRQGLREAGMIEGHDFRIELRYAQDGPQHFPELVAELVRIKVDVISPAGDFALRIAQQATSTMPELIHVIQWRLLGRERFLVAYANGLDEFGYVKVKCLFSQDRPLNKIPVQISNSVEPASPSMLLPLVNRRKLIPGGKIDYFAIEGSKEW
jgi:hypothetical protein